MSVQLRSRASRSIVGFILALLFAGEAWAAKAATETAAAITFVFASDVHYGLHRGNFRGSANVEARTVGAALVKTINALPEATLPQDGGFRAGQRIGPVDFAVVTGDITNRAEVYPLRIQSSAESWRQFEDSFLNVFALKRADGAPAPLLLVPGNHDVSNAIGSPTPLMPATDATAMTEIYNRMMQPAVPRTRDTYRYATDKVYFLRNFGGALCIFLTMWPDRVTREWIARDLATVSDQTPVFIFCHDQPDIEAKHLTNPNGRHDVNGQDRFENVVPDICADGATVDVDTIVEQRALAGFLKAHRNIVGYFHGNSNWNEFYTWTGPDNDIALNVFRADSPIKGKVSGKDEAKLSFQIVTYDVAAKTLTARECLWNARGRDQRDDTPVSWGAAQTISLARRAK